MSYYPSKTSYQLIVLSENTTLNWPYFSDNSTPGGSFVEITDFIDIYCNADNLILYFPDATLSTLGQNFILNNLSSYNILLKTNDDNNTIITLNAGTIYQFYLIKNDTQGGIWRAIPFGSGYNSLTQIQVNSSDSSIVVNNGTINPPGGKIDIKLPTNINNLNNLFSTTSAEGLPFVKDGKWYSIDMLQGNGIVITDLGDNVPGSRTINLASDVNFTTMVVGNSSKENYSQFSRTGVDFLGFVGSPDDTYLIRGISAGIAIDASENINITSDKNITLNGLTIDNNNNILNVNKIDGDISNKFIPKAWCNFTSNNTGSNVVTIQNKIGISSIVNTNGYYKINFSTPFIDTSYGVLLSLGASGNPPNIKVKLPFVSLKETTAVTIVVTDYNGEIVSDISDGITVVILNS